ncbi:MAG: hypothetical protein WA190_08285 [Usitatibacter sp.]
MKSRTDFLQDIVRQYLDAGHSTPANPKDIARWAIEKGLWAQRPEAVITQCADQIARAMAQEYFNDASGHRIRAKHAVVYPEGPYSYSLWDDIRTADYQFVSVSLQQGRRNILNQCKQLKNDADYYNEEREPPAKIQLVFNFELDLEEMELARGAKRAA